MKKIFIIASLVMLATACCNTTKCPKADGGCTTADSCQTKCAESITFNNEDFYTDGKFDEDKAKEAVIALMRYHDYPVFDGIKEQLWVSDYGTGEFTKLGLAAICQINNETDLYMLQDLFLLPGQMLPEHWHEKPANLPVKMEAWFIRNGESYIVGEGEDNMASFPDVVVPQCHMDGKVTVAHIVLAKPGQTVKLDRATARHWQFAGKEGAIMSEVANVHSNPEVRHSDEKINAHFLGK